MAAKRMHAEMEQKSTNTTRGMLNFYFDKKSGPGMMRVRL